MMRSALLKSSAGCPWLDMACWTAPAVVVTNAAWWPPLEADVLIAGSREV
jgi:hypothetical protein